jgi:hypothetical protein
MSIVRYVLIGLIFLASLGFAYLAASTLKTQASWRMRVAEFENKLPGVIQENETLEFGDAQANATPYRPEDGLLKADQSTRGKLGLRQFEVALYDQLVDRGRVWDAQRGQVAAATGDVSVTIDLPNPQIKDKTVLYAFDKRGVSEGGKYLGAFKVTGVNEQTVALAPTHTLSPNELKRVNESPAEWVLYETMPVDRHTAFSGLTDEELTALLPEDTRSEYLRDGKAAEPTDPPEQVVTDAEGNKKYVRTLRDYAVSFRDLHKFMALTQDTIRALSSDVAYMQKAVASAEGQLSLRDAEIANLKADLEKTEKERDLVKAQEAAMSAKLAEIRAQSAKVFAENRRMAEQWTAMQVEAAKSLNLFSGVATPAP